MIEMKGGEAQCAHVSQTALGLRPVVGAIGLSERGTAPSHTFPVLDTNAAHGTGLIPVERGVLEIR